MTNRESSEMEFSLFPSSLLPIRYSPLPIRRFHAIAGFTCRAIASVISAATTHKAPAMKKAGR